MRNKRLVNLTESRVNRIISETISNLINELSTDTMDSAREKAGEKYEKAYRNYGGSDPRTQQAQSQHKKFKDSWDKEFIKGNTARQARMHGNREKRQKGERTYVSGKGWRNKSEDDDSHHADNANQSLSKAEKYIKFCNAKEKYPNLMVLIADGDYLETYAEDAIKVLYAFGNNPEVKQFKVEFYDDSYEDAARFPKDLAEDASFKQHFRYVICDEE